MTAPRSYRLERDALGEVKVPTDALYGPQTARAAGWTLTPQRMPIALVHALARIKACAAHVHGQQDRLPSAQADAIERAALEVAEGRHDEQFVVGVFQTGSGTSTNMNANEVIATRANALLGERDGDDAVHPNDDVNLGQSSNDVIPSAMQLALVTRVRSQLLPALTRLVERFDRLAREHWDRLRDGRTHLMRATPIRFGQQFRGHADQLRAAAARIEAAADGCAALPLGGTAVGTGMGCPPGFAGEVCAELERRFGVAVRETCHHLGAQGGVDAVGHLVATQRTTAATLFKIVEDLRWQASDALEQVELPAMQPGSSMMPGKINPVVCEAVGMLCAQIFGCDAAVAFAGSQGRFELTTMLPVVAANALEAVELLAAGCDGIERHALRGLQLTDRAGADVGRNPILATALVDAIGYDRASSIAKTALREGTTVHQVAQRETDLSDEELRRLLDPRRMCGDFGEPEQAE